MTSKEKAKNIVRLFGMSALQLSTEKKELQKRLNIKLSPHEFNPERDPDYYPQFDLDVRNTADKMAKYYEIFYCLENSVRRIVRERMEAKYKKKDWWTEAVHQTIRDEVKKRIERDLDSGFTMRSEDHLDFANFGELQNIIEKDWDAFEELFTSRNAAKKVLTSLNSLRGPIAHCCALADDEVLRLHLTMKDWFRLMS